MLCLDELWNGKLRGHAMIRCHVDGAFVVVRASVFFAPDVHTNRRLFVRRYAPVRADNATFFIIRGRPARCMF